MNVALLLFHHVHELDVVGPYSMLDAARHCLEDPESFTVTTIAKSRNSVETSGGLILTPHWAFASAPEPDVLIVPGGAGVDTARHDRTLCAYLSQQAQRLELLAAVGTGAILLGELGLVRDLRATTHPDARDRLLDYEAGEISVERVVKNDNGVWFASGASAGLDLGLELVHELCGPAVAQHAAHHLDYPYAPSRKEARAKE